MRLQLALSALASLSYALVAREPGCCFQLTASGGPGGLLGQLGDGQNRIGQGLPPATYCINNGGINDGNGRGCILTPPTTQFQCDAGAAPNTGFSIGCGGTLQYNGNTQFVACPTGDHGGYNIYVTPPTGQQGCVSIILTTGGGACSTCAPPTPAPAPPANTCPLELGNSFQFPHLIIPIDSTLPNKAFGTSYDGSISSTVSSIFNFDIPASDAGRTCTVAFSLPRSDQLQTSGYSLIGAGAVDFDLLAEPATSGTSWNNAPKPVASYGTFQIVPGNSYVLAKMSCPSFKAIGIRMSSHDGTCLSYFQDYNPCPIGLYIVES